MKVRTVITTDGEVDDMNSMIRALLYCNEYDLAGIILTSSMYHWAGNNKDMKPYRWTGEQWIYEYIDNYEKVYHNLKAHDSNYIEPSKLRSITKIGNISYKGEMTEVSEGSQFLEELFLDDDPRKLYVQTWGGTNTTARALKSIEEKYKNTNEWKTIQQKINNKLIIYIILDQDDSYDKYIKKYWPDIEIINDRSNFWHFAYMWKNHDERLNKCLQGKWCFANLVKDKGPLMEKYALIGDGRIIEGEEYDELRGTEDYLSKNPQYHRYDFISEGDSPSFLYLIDVGLRSLEDPRFGGWGSRFGPGKKASWENTTLDYNPYTHRYEASYTLTRWFDDIQNDFASRVDWCLTDDEAMVEHAPIISVKEGLDIEASPNEKITLTAIGDDDYTYRWWRYHEADTYQDSISLAKEEIISMEGLQLDIIREDEVVDKIVIEHPNDAQMSFVVPDDAKKGDTIHMVVEAQNHGKHHLKRYQRVIITIR